MFQNTMPRYEILSPDAMDVLDRGWRRIVSEIGVEFILPEAVEIFRAAGCKTEGANVWLDPDFILEQVAKVPREFELQARNPEKSVTIGGDNMVFSAVYGPPFAREGDVRREATKADFENFVRLAQSFDELDSPGGTICEPNDIPLDSRHLDMVYALMTLSDKPHMGSVTSGPNAADTVAMSEILFGGARRDRSQPGVALPDQRQLTAAVRRPHAVGDAHLQPSQPSRDRHAVPADGRDVAGDDPSDAGAADGRGAGRDRAHPTGAAGLPGGVRVVSLQHRPAVGLPRLRHPRVRHRPALHRPDRTALRSALAGGGGGLTSSQTVDAQAAYEALMTMLPAFLAGANYVMHSAGWLESGLVSCYEKFIVDIEILRMLKEEFTPLEIDEDSLAWGAHVEVGAGGHFLGAEHTLERFRTCFYRPLLSSTENFERWQRKGGADATARASTIWRETLENYEQPPLDEGIRLELEEYVNRRRTELGD